MVAGMENPRNQMPKRLKFSRAIFPENTFSGPGRSKTQSINGRKNVAAAAIKKRPGSCITLRRASVYRLKIRLAPVPDHRPARKDDRLDGISSEDVC